jgi:hypothetical protein
MQPASHASIEVIAPSLPHRVIPFTEQLAVFGEHSLQPFNSALQPSVHSEASRFVPLALQLSAAPSSSRQWTNWPGSQETAIHVFGSLFPATEPSRSQNGNDGSLQNPSSTHDAGFGLVETQAHPKQAIRSSLVFSMRIPFDHTP